MILQIIASRVVSLGAVFAIGGHWIHVSHTHPDGFWLVLFSLFILGTLVLYRIFRDVFSYSRWSDSVFVALFFGALCIPMLNISDAEISEVENRTLAKPAHLIEDYALNNKFGAQFDAWFNDRFYLRDTLLNLHGKSMGAAGQGGNSHVLIGEENWLFAANSIQYLNTGNTYRPHELEKVGTYIKSLADWCRRHNKRFVFMIAPNKGAVYPEYVRNIRRPRPGSASRVEQLRAWLQENSDVELLYPLDDMIAHKDDGLLYYKNDTHWNELGGWYGYLHIMDAIKMRPIKISGTTTDIRERGDLTNLMPGVKGEPDLVYTIPTIAENAKCDKDLYAGNLNCVNSHGRGGGIFVMRDSFMLAMGPYLINTFQRSHFVWHYVPTEADLKVMASPEIDTVMLVMVERLLGSIEVDPIRAQ